MHVTVKEELWIYHQFDHQDLPGLIAADPIRGGGREDRSTGWLMVCGLFLENSFWRAQCSTCCHQLFLGYGLLHGQIIEHIYVCVRLDDQEVLYRLSDVGESSDDVFEETYMQITHNQTSRVKYLITNDYLLSVQLFLSCE